MAGVSLPHPLPGGSDGALVADLGPLFTMPD